MPKRHTIQSARTDAARRPRRPGTQRRAGGPPTPVAFRLVAAGLFAAVTAAVAIPAASARESLWDRIFFDDGTEVRVDRGKPCEPLYRDELSPEWRRCFPRDLCTRDHKNAAGGCGAAPCAVVLPATPVSAANFADFAGPGESRRERLEQSGLLTAPIRMKRRTPPAAAVPVASAAPPPLAAGSPAAPKVEKGETAIETTLSTPDTPVMSTNPVPVAAAPTPASVPEPAPSLRIEAVESVGPKPGRANDNDGFEALAGWTVADWNDTKPITASLMDGGDHLRAALPPAAAAFVNAQLRLQSDPAGRAPEKSAVEITLPDNGRAARLPAVVRDDLLAAASPNSPPARVEMRAANTGEESVQVAVGLTLANNAYYESLPVAVAAGQSGNLAWTVADPRWKCAAGNWQHTAAIPAGAGRVRKVAVILYSPAENAGRPLDLWIDQLRFPPAERTTTTTPASPALPAGNGQAAYPAPASAPSAPLVSLIPPTVAAPSASSPLSPSPPSLAAGVAYRIGPEEARPSRRPSLSHH